MAKIRKCFNYSIFIYIYRSQIVQNAEYFLPKKSGFAKQASFDPGTAISDMNLKLCVTTYLYLSQ